MIKVPKVAIIAIGTVQIALCMFACSGLFPTIPELGLFIGAAIGCAINVALQARFQQGSL